ncbi:phage tail tape measure protein [Pseudomonas sp. 1176_21]|uniref:phage tail tape measure protein n=1 Tax=Pseudomonas sp. 1176_21 TaxID=2604453 RepID=UPI0040635F25
MSQGDIAVLGVRVESGEAVTAADNLENFAKAGERAEKAAAAVGAQARSSGVSIKDLAASSSAAEQSMGKLASAEEKVAETASEAMARLTAMAKASLEASDYHKGLASSVVSVGSAMETSKSAATDWSAYQAQINERGRALIETEDRIAAAARQAAVTTGTQADGLQELLGRIDPAVAALGRLDDMERRLQGFKASGALDADTFADYKGKIDQAREGLSRMDSSLSRTGMSARATAAALRGVPAQLTDIVVSLQGGQAPLTVFLQQGGQLKDMFGGIGPAARAMGGYIAGLINPFTLAGAAVAGLGVAYYKGSEEQEAFRKSLILSGNAAGTNVGAMADLSRQIASTVGTTGAAAEILAQLAGNANIAGESIGTVATASLQMKDATGRAVEQTVAEFVKIGKDPVSAAKELNDQYNFLTASTYAQIAALKEQGDTVGAAKLLTDTYAQTIDSRTKEIVENLGWIEKAWRGVWGMTKNAGDAALDFGRSASLADQLAEAQKDLAALEKNVAGNSIVAKSAEAGNERALLESRIQALNDQIRLQKSIDQAQENYRQRQRDSILSQETLNGQLRTTASNQDKLAARLEEINELAKKSAAGDGGRVYTDAELNQLRDAAREQFKEKSGPAGPTYREDAGTKALDQARQQYSVLQQQNGLIGAQRGEMQKLGEAGQALVKWEQQLADIKDKKVLTADQKSLLANQQQVTAQLQKNAGLEKEMQLRKVSTEEAQKLAAFQGNLNSQLQRASLGLDSNLAGMGLGDVARQRMQERLSIEQQYQQQMDNLQQQRNEGRISESLYEKENQALQKALDSRLARQEKYYQDVDAQQQDWSLGARSAFSTYLEQARDVAGQTRTLFGNAFTSMEDAVANFAITGKLSFSDFTKSVLADMARIATRQAASGLLSSIAGSALGSWFSGAGGAAASAGSTQAGYGPQFMDNFVSGQRAAGGPVAANSLYQVNELGPELLNQGGKTYLMMGAEGGTITPLGAGPTSVAAAGGGASTSISVNAPVNISVPDRSGEGMELDHGLLQQNMQKQMEIAAQKAVAESWRPGGISHRNATRRT